MLPRSYIYHSLLSCLAAGEQASDPPSTPYSIPSMALPDESRTAAVATPPATEVVPAVAETEVVTVDVWTAARELEAEKYHHYLDVRTKEEMEKLGHLRNSLNVPYFFITPQGREKNPLFVEQVASLMNREHNILVGCQSGKRSELACIHLIEAGFSNVKNMGGGYAAWLQNGFPVVSDQKPEEPEHAAAPQGLSN